MPRGFGWSVMNWSHPMPEAAVGEAPHLVRRKVERVHTLVDDDEIVPGPVHLAELDRHDAAI